MARQAGPNKITGTIGDVIFYERKGEYFLKKKPYFDAKRFATDPAFAIQRKTMAELGRGSKATKLVRQALAIPLTHLDGCYVHSRLNRVMTNVIKGDKINERGMRNPADGEITLLEGFDFNEKRPLSKLPLLPPFTASIDRQTGIMAVHFPKFERKKRVVIPPDATHFMLQITGAELNFDGNQHIQALAKSADFPIKGILPDQLTLQVSLPPGSQHPLLLALSISFLQESNGRIKPLSSFMYNAMALVKVSGL